MADFFFWYERGKFPFRKTKIKKEKENMGSFGEEEVFGKRGLADAWRREKENKAVVVPPEKRGMKKERKKEREKSEKNRKGVVDTPKWGDTTSFTIRL